MRLEITEIHGLQQLIEQVVSEVLGRIEKSGIGKRSDGRLAYSESEAASLLGVAKHVLRDVRYRGGIHARKVGREWRYSYDDLVKFLSKNG